MDAAELGLQIRGLPPTTQQLTLDPALMPALERAWYEAMKDPPPSVLLDGEWVPMPLPDRYVHQAIVERRAEVEIAAGLGFEPPAPSVLCVLAGWR